MTEKLDHRLVTNETKQTCNEKIKLAFRDSSIDKIDRTKI